MVSRAIKEYNKSRKSQEILELIVHTGQHFDENMSSIFFDQMGIPKTHYNPEINSLTHGAMTGKMLEKIEAVLLKEKPDWVLVYGDTNSTIAGALAAKKLHIKVAHLEAGLKSFNMQMPEEINRILTDRISDILFCPTQMAMDNLVKEGYENIKTKRIKCGDVMYDAALYYSDNASPPRKVDVNVDFVLSTIHRQENTDNKVVLESIFSALSEIASKQRIIMPVHPRTIKKLNDFGIDIPKNIQILKPVGYFEMIWLLKNCSLVISDSGGLQKEAFFFKKPCITVREETEWIELVQNKVNFITGSDKNLIITTHQKLQEMDINFEIDLYGKGDTGEKIVLTLASYQD